VSCNPRSMVVRPAPMRRRWIAVLAGTVLGLAGCSPQAQPAAVPTAGCTALGCSVGPQPAPLPRGAAVPTAPTFSVDPGTTTCAASSLVIAGDATHWEGLAACAGSVSVSPLPHWRTQVQVPSFLVSVEQRDNDTWSIGADRPDDVLIRGHTVIPIRAGTVVLTVTGLNCDGHGGGTCPVVQLDIDP
jgi:hypothetical protein